MRLERKKFGGASPIILPPKLVDGQQLPSGAGWLRAEVLDFDNFVLNFAGGGDFTAYATDANNETLVWDFSFKTSQYPEKIPYTMAEASAPAMMAQAGTPMTSVPATPTPATGFPFSALQGPSPATFPVQTPNGMIMLTAAQAQQYQAQQAMAQQQQPQFGGGFQGGNWGLGGFGGPFSLWRAGGFGDTPSREDDRTRKLEEQIQELKLDRERSLHDKQLEALRAERAQEAQQFRDEMRRIQESIASKEQQNPARDEIAQIRAEMDRRDADHKREMERRDMELRTERERAERERRDAERDRQNAEQWAAIREEMRAIREQPKGPDPLLEFLKESSRRDIETARYMSESQREEARSRQAQFEKFIEINERNKAGVDGLLNNVIGSFSRIFDTYRSVMESVAQVSSSGQTGPVAGMVQEAIGRASEIANKWVEAKGQAGAATVRAQAQTAQAQAQVATAQMQQNAIQLERERMAQQQAAHTTPAPQSQRNGNGKPLAGASNVIPMPSKNGNGPEAAAPPIVSPTENQLFGENPAVIEAVHNLRGHVKAGRTDPENAFKAILVAVDQSQKLNIIAPVFILFQEGRWGDLAEALLPDVVFPSHEAAVTYRTQLVEYLVEWEEQSGDGGEGGDEPENGVVPAN